MLWNVSQHLLQLQQKNKHFLNSYNNNNNKTKYNNTITNYSIIIYTNYSNIVNLKLALVD